LNSTALIHALIDGVLTGSVYALMATGLTLIFGVMDLINVAQGILVVLGAYLSYALSVHFGIDLFVGLAITIPTLFVVGIVVERFFMARLKGPERTAMSILVTYAISLVIEGALNMIFSVNPVQLQAWYVNRSFSVFGIYIAYIYLFGFIMAAVLLGALYGVLWSRCGRHRRWWHGVRRDQRVQCQHQLRPHFATAGDHRIGWHGKPGRCAPGRNSDGDARGPGRRGVVTSVVADLVLRRVGHRPVAASPGTLR
jgi:ABC-type branched-subunit amino acid transport system permease subunit